MQKLLSEVAQNFTNMRCSIRFAYCGRASCTRHERADSSNGAEVATCSCREVAPSHEVYAEMSLTDANLLSTLAQSSKFVEMMRGYARGDVPLVEAKSRLCAAIGERDFYPGLAADLVSLPSPPWDTAHEESVVERMHCDEDLAIALCSGAPCYTDASRGDAPLNVSCLCPVYPFSGSKSFMLTPPDVGHTGGCAARAASRTARARRQASSDAPSARRCGAGLSMLSTRCEGSPLDRRHVPQLVRPLDQALAPRR